MFDIKACVKNASIGALLRNSFLSAMAVALVGSFGANATSSKPAHRNIKISLSRAQELGEIAAVIILKNPSLVE